jgi:phosphoribosylformimino-5-aminoimidazole carboxamide ribotide isomerase
LKNHFIRLLKNVRLQGARYHEERGVLFYTSHLAHHSRRMFLSSLPRKTNMIIIPAIDLKNGKCVRLSQGEMHRETVYSDNPVETALKWQQLGAERLHIVDLDGAISGEPHNREAIRRIRASVEMHIEIGGGIRDMDTVADYLDSGIDSVILGTAAIKDPELRHTACERYPGRIIIGIDARDGLVSVQGWTEDTATTAIDFARQLDESSVAAIVFTDISRDGMLTGPNIESTVELARSIKIPVIASGGLSSLDDIRRLLKVKQHGIMGAITGRALYTGDLDLGECIALTKK